MLLIHCPNCEHDNTPGERFCAVCGVPLDLKPCPRCGKVDQLTAKVCSGCGAAFPAIVIAHIDGDAAPTDDAPKPPAETVPARPAAPANRAWPLILVALAAGGIPLLWMNRAYMPLPKAWQIQGPNAAGSAVTAAPTVAPTPPPVAPAAPAADAPGTEPAKGGDSATSAPDTARPKTAAAALPARKVSPKRAGPSAVHPQADQADTKSASARPCTEALAALNLCDPKTEQK